MFARKTIVLGLASVAMCTGLTAVGFAQMADMKPMADTAGKMMEGKGDAAMLAELMKVKAKPEMAGDKLFVLSNADGNMFEVALSKLVASKSQDAKVKELCMMIEKDHGAANEKLKPIAEKMGLALASDITALQKAKLDILAEVPPADLAKSYLMMQRAIHAHDVTMFADHASVAKDPDLKTYITETLPKLKEHGAHINMVAKEMGAAEPNTPADSLKM